MEQKKEYKLYKRRWVVLLSFVCVNAVMQYGWAFFSSIVTDAWHFYGFQVPPAAKRPSARSP